ncbi:MAG: ABC transporter substrate binding protein [Gammaproteobacteria bacterium]
MKALRILLLALASLCCTANALSDTVKGDFSTSPRTNNGEKWRIGYYEGGPDANYADYLGAVVRGLMDLGWIEIDKLPNPEAGSSEPLWRWLASRARSEYLEFVPNAFYSAQWDVALRTELKRDILRRLDDEPNLDVMIAMGTWAGLDLSNDKHTVPTIVMSTSDPIGTGIIQSAQNSGRDHVHARVDPLRYERQVRMFHDVIGFSTLGVAYENTVEGRSYAAMGLVEKVAKQRGFEIVPCYTQSDIADRKRAGESVIECFEKLVKQVDAVYVTQQGGVNAHTIPELVQLANRHRVPTFSQSGSREVKSGFLLSISRPSFLPVGRFLGATIAKVLNGAKPRQLDQLFEEAPNIAINLKTAEIIGLYLYADVLAASDELYREIVPPQGQ